MPIQTIPRGGNVNIGANIVAGHLYVYGVAANYTISINGAAAVAHVAAVGVVDTYAANNQSVAVANTTVAGGPDNLTISWA